MRPAVPNAVLGVVLLIGAEVMMFAALISAYLIYRIGGAGSWPPPGQTLPLGLTAANTAVLLASGILAWKGRSGAGILLGAAFLAVQGYEWVRLVGYGIRMTKDIYGATFYALVGLHAAHVLAGLAWLAASRLLRRGEGLARIYWAFVVLLWPVLFGLVYLPWNA